MICKCTKTSTEDISRMVADGARDWVDVSQECGAGRYCGGCLRDLRAEVENAKTSGRAKQAA